MVITRFAPSPTGRFHVGVARTALFSYLWAKKNNGKFILRIDDTDKERSKIEYEEEIKAGLNFLGIKYDEIFRQSDRIARYKEVTDWLIENGFAYRCYCSPEELERYRQEALRKKMNPRYPGTCRSRKDFPKDKPFAVRFKVPDDIFTVEFEDLVMKKISVNSEEIEDFTLLRSNGLPTYNLASVVDDVDFKITHVIRGADHISNTPKQILLFRILGHIPQFAHLPLILPDEGEGKLSKRVESINSIYILDLKKDGFLTEAVTNHLARLGWAYKDKEIFSMDELIQLFDISEVNRTPARYNFKKLYWLNSEWIKILPDDILIQRLSEFLDFSDTTAEKIKQILPAVKVRVNSLLEMANMIKPLLSVETYDEEGVKEFFNETGKYILEELKEKLATLSDGENSRLEFDKILSELSQKYNVKKVFVAQVLRLALYGKLVSPPLYEVIRVLGIDETVKRIEKVIQRI